MDYFIKKENYKGKKPNHHSVNTGLSAPKWKSPNADSFLLLHFLITSLYLTLLVRKVYMKKEKILHEDYYHYAENFKYHSSIAGIENIEAYK